jgi:hypothetical protein
MQITRLDMAPGALSDYYDWMKAANSGDVLIYWTGDLQFDRQVVISDNDVMRAADRQNIAQLNAVASRIFVDAKLGQLHLTQRKVSETVYEYRAARRRQSYGSSSVTSVLPNDQLVLA